MVFELVIELPIQQLMAIITCLMKDILTMSLPYITQEKIMDTYITSVRIHIRASDEVTVQMNLKRVGNINNLSKAVENNLTSLVEAIQHKITLPPKRYDL